MRGAYRHVSPASALPDAAFAADAQMLSDAINGSNDLLEALKTGKGPDRFPWREQAGAANWTARQGSKTGNFMALRVSLIHEREAIADALRVNRDPCGCCGTRGDIGCEHRRMA